MAKEFTLNAEPRPDAGRGASRRLRREGRVPAILYGGTEGAQAITLDHNELIQSLKHEAFHSHILTIKLGKKSEQAILKDIQHHPFKHEVLHLDLLRIEAGHKLYMEVPLHFKGADVAPGVKAGGVFSRNVVEVEIQCLPKDLPEYLEIDVSGLEIGDSVHLSDVPLPAGVEIVALSHGDGHDSAIAAVHHPRVTEEEEAAEAAEAAEAVEEGAETPAATGETPAEAGEDKPKQKKEESSD